LPTRREMASAPTFWNWTAQILGASVGGHHEAALKRAAIEGDGWLHGGGDPADLPGLLARLAERGWSATSAIATVSASRAARRAIGGRTRAS